MNWAHFQHELKYFTLCDRIFKTISVLWPDSLLIRLESWLAQTVQLFRLYQSLREYHYSLCRHRRSGRDFTLWQTFGPSRLLFDKITSWIWHNAIPKCLRSRGQNGISYMRGQKLKANTKSKAYWINVIKCLWHVSPFRFLGWDTVMSISWLPENRPSPLTRDFLRSITRMTSGF